MTDTELEALVAKHVFGLSPEATDRCIAWGTRGGAGWATSMTGAWQVVEAMEARGFPLVLYRLPARQTWKAEFSPTYCREASTAPLAICLAALAALEVTHGSL